MLLYKQGQSVCMFVGSFLPAEVKQWSCGGGDAISWPAQQVKLGQGTCLLRLDIFQVEATHQEVLAPDVF